MSRKPVAIRVVMKGWEGTYVSGSLVEQGPPIRADQRAAYERKRARLHGYDLDQMKIMELEPRDQQMVNDQYILPDKITQLHGKYSGERREL